MVKHGLFMGATALIPLWDLKLHFQLWRRSTDLFGVISSCPVLGTWLSIAVQHISAGLAAKTTHIYHPTLSVGPPSPGFSQGCRPGVSWVGSHLKVRWGRVRFHAHSGCWQNSACQGPQFPFSSQVGFSSMTICFTVVCKPSRQWDGD